MDTEENTLHKIDDKIEEIKNEQKLRLERLKNKKLRQQALENSFRYTEKQIHYLIGEMIIRKWGKKKTIEELEKYLSDFNTDSRKSLIEKYKAHYKKDFQTEDNKVENNNDSQTEGNNTETN